MFDTFFYNPIYNALIGLIDIFPLIDLGIAAIIITILVKFILLPFSLSASHTQQAMKEIKPQVDEINAKYKGKKDRDSIEAKGKELMELYKENNIRPFASIPIMIVQFPVFIALYWILYAGGLPEVQVERLYSFVPAPEMISMTFLGFFDLTGRSILLALIAGGLQLGYTKLAFGKNKEEKGGKKPSPMGGQDFAEMLQFQMTYGLPIFIAGFSFFFPVIALYFIASNLFMIFQELFVKKKRQVV